MAKWSSPSAFRACPQLTQGPNLCLSFFLLFRTVLHLSNSLETLLSLPGLVLHPRILWGRDRVDASSLESHLPLQEANKAQIPSLLTKVDAEIEGRRTRKDHFFFFFSWLIPMALYQLRSLQTLGSSQMGQHGKVSSASTAWSVRNASYEPFSRVCSLKSHYLALKEW